MKPIHFFLLLLIALLTGVLLWALPIPAPQPAPEPTAVFESAAPEPTPAAATEDPAALLERREAEMNALLAAFAARQEGRWSLAWWEPQRGTEAAYASDAEPMVSASLIKLFIMAAVYERREAGTLDEASTEDALTAMISVSDNAAANELVLLLGAGDAQAGMAAVNDFCARFGCAETRMERLMLAGNGLQNYTSAGDCAALLSAILAGDCVSRKASAAMLELLLCQRIADRLPARLPEGTRVAHKTGDLAGLSCGDVGILYTPDGPVILCAICNDQASDAAAAEAIAALAEDIYRFEEAIP